MKKSNSLDKLLGAVQAEDGIRDVERSRGLGDVYKRQLLEDGRPVVLQYILPVNKEQKKYIC